MVLLALCRAGAAPGRAPAGGAGWLSRRRDARRTGGWCAARSAARPSYRLVVRRRPGSATCWRHRARRGHRCWCCSGSPARSAASTCAEALVIFGLSASAFALADLLVGNIERITTVRAHRPLDAVLVRPLGALPQLLLMDLAAAPGRPGRCSAPVVLVGGARPGRRRLDAGPGGCWSSSRRSAGAVFFGAIFVAQRHRGVLVDRVRRVRQRVHLRRAGLHRRTRSPSTADWFRARLRVRPGVRVSSPTTRRWRCWAAPTRSACRPGSGWCSPLVALRRGRRRPRWSGGPASGTTGARGHDRRRDRGARAAQGLHRHGSRPAGCAATQAHGGRGRRRGPARSSAARCSATSARTAPASPPR